MASTPFCGSQESVYSDLALSHTQSASQVFVYQEFIALSHFIVNED